MQRQGLQKNCKQPGQHETHNSSDEQSEGQCSNLESHGCYANDANVHIPMIQMSNQLVYQHPTNQSFATSTYHHLVNKLVA